MVVSELSRDVALQVAQPSDDPTLRLLRDKVLKVADSLVQADNARQLRSAVNSAVRDYVPILEIVSGAIVAEIIKKQQTVQSIFQQLHEGVWDALEPNVGHVLSQLDRRIILDVLSDDQRLAEVVDEIPEENRAYLCGALIDGYWPLKKMALCLTSVLFISDGTLQPRNAKVAHWLCLAMRDYHKEWRIALFSNDPVLHSRLVTPGKKISIEEMEKRVGL